MGCADLFCLLCGNTYRSFLDANDFLEFYIKQYKININPKLFSDKIKKLKRDTNWLYKCTFLCANNKVVHGCSEIGCNNQFVDANKNLYIHSTVYDSDNMYGVFVHTDCWKFVKNEFKIELNYSYLPIIKNKLYYNKIFSFIDYGIIEKYWEQNFDFFSIVNDSNEELCYSPLKSTLVAKNIKKVLSQLKIKYNPERKGPHTSATFYKNNLFKIGSNGNIWFTKSNKWLEIKDTIKKTINKLPRNIVYSGEYNDKPFFIVNKKNVEYKILTTN
jgi:hypothetical protein